MTVSSVRTRVVGLLVAACVVLGTTSCGFSGGSGTAGGGSSPDAPKTAVLDEAAAAEASIVASDGGSIGLKTAEGVVRVTLPSDALAKDMTLVMTPLSTAPGEDADTLVKGFRLEEKGTGAGPALAHPAWVEWVVPEELGADATVVRYAEDGSYEALPTRMKVGKGITAVQALADHFSNVGIRKFKGGGNRTSFDDFNWVVYINNTQKGTSGPLKQSVSLKLRAVNTGGDIAGDFAGNATIKSTNTGDIMGGTMTSPQSGQAGSVKITLKSVDPLADLTDDPDPLATLTPDEMPKWWGSGTIQMSAMDVAGSATGRIGGYSGTGGTKNTSSLPVVMEVDGTQVKLSVSLAPGKMTFTGYVIGEGKK